MGKVHVFNAGPCILPEQVIDNTIKALKDFKETGMSVLSISHRAKEWEETMNECRALWKELLHIPDTHEVVFLGGGQSSCEAALDKALEGKHPVVVEFLDDLITAPGTCLANSSYLRDALPFNHVPVHLRSSVTEIGDGYCMIKNFETGEEWKEECDAVINGIGFVPNDRFSSYKYKNLHRVGTCVKWGNLRHVIWGAWDVAMKI